LINRLVLCFVTVAVIAFAQVSFGASAETIKPPTFALPIKCTLGNDCYIMHYVDLNPSDKEVDFGCGRQTYRGHDGTDFGIPDMEAMRRGVPVLAASGGIVLRVRDNVPDRMIADPAQRSDVNNVECGNGLVIDHGHGWQTQYCHLRNGSIAVKPGNRVYKGTVLGMVGSSGLASFPHVHFTVRYQGKVVDPFVGITNLAGCNVPRYPLWEQSPDYVPTGLIRAGFAPKRPAQTELWQGKYSSGKADLKTLPALVFWVHLFGVLEGDSEHFALTAPDKRVVIDTEKPLTKNYKSWVSCVGKRNAIDHQLPRGEWRGAYQLKRGNRVLINVERVFVVK
jgi:murein DD-endopeptidase